jgi:membrane fusion protein, multidrug efflux system
MRASRLLLFAIGALDLFSLAGHAQNGQFATVIAKPVSKTVELPGEFLPFLSVEISAKVPGYVERVFVDRGSIVRQGELLVVLSAPEMQAEIAEAEAKVQAAEADRAQARAQLAAEQSTYERTKQAAETPGAIAGNELVLAQERVKAAQSALHSREQASHVAEEAVRAVKDLQAYLKISAPFSGVITDRLVHPGAFVGPASDHPLLTLQQVSHLRLVVPLPEEYVDEIVNGASVSFQVPAFPGRTYTGKIARISHSLDQKTRTMAVELDVMNTDGTLAPGMYPTVKWPVHSRDTMLFVPKTSVVTTTERTFVIRDRDGKAEWINVKKVAADDDLFEVLGDLKPGEKIVRRATDEIQDGATLTARVH